MMASKKSGPPNSQTDRRIKHVEMFQHRNPLTNFETALEDLVLLAVRENGQGYRSHRDGREAD